MYTTEEEFKEAVNTLIRDDESIEVFNGIMDTLEAQATQVVLDVKESEVITARERVFAIRGLRTEIMSRIHKERV